ncbi:efflux RND transporter periplasmic adaptor subunit [Ensifer sp.]|jgi:putative peptide zinc metalloprotease protein|uniref:efflux RND transporter periplasmic adaptor subunit n=1 Tax=Ensifer sp. TaxID=1872086 RepID=UPI002E165081|nr:site-2 protease family protein [Ensifer sp.]
MADDRLRLRPELRFIYRDEGPREIVVIEDPLGGGFMETDPETAAFARLLDGTVSAGEAHARLQLEYPGAQLKQNEVAQLVDELKRHGLLVGSESAAPQGGRKNLGVISQRIRLGTWDRFFRFCARRLTWLYGPIGVCLWLGLLVAGAAELVGNWSAFRNSLGSLFSLDMVVLLWLAWVVSKLWHECQHGIVARLYGVEIREVGILFILFMPLGAYVDATGAWRVQSRWRRLHITAAGIMGELALGAAAVLLWSQAEPGQWKAFLQSLIVATTLSTVVFNANPLMRYDGYYALVDLFGVSNLYQRGAVAARDRALRLLTGIGPKVSEPRGIEFYGWLAFVWRLIAATTLTLVATHLAFGFGLVLAAVVVWTMVLVPLSRFLRTAWKLTAGNRRATSLRAGCAVALFVVFWFAPIPVWLSAPGVIDYRDALEVRTTSAGLVTDIFVSSGDRVEAGDPLVRLSNQSLQADRKRLMARKAGVDILLARALDDRDPSAQEGAEQALSAMRDEIADTEQRVAGLDITAQQSGVIYGNDIDALEGRWIERGHLFGEIAEPRRTEIKVWLLPEDVGLLREGAADMSFKPAVFGTGAIPVTLLRIEPTASNALPPPSVTAEGGGPLAVDISGAKHRLVDVRFSSVFLPSDTPHGWVAGTPGRLTSGLRWRSVGSFASEWLHYVNLGHLPRWAHYRN